jgi:hypothetical protein
LAGDLETIPRNAVELMKLESQFANAMSDTYSPLRPTYSWNNDGAPESSSDLTPKQEECYALEVSTFDVNAQPWLPKPLQESEFRRSFIEGSINEGQCVREMQLSRRGWHPP